MPQQRLGPVQQISIHALREEGDAVGSTGTSASTNFYPRPPRGGRLGELLHSAGRHVISIHALREEGDRRSGRPHRDRRLFLSTPSARRATYLLDLLSRMTNEFLSTPSARRATSRRCRCCRSRPISIHALREEGDLLSMGIVPGMCLFLSTPSARRATKEDAHDPTP